MATGESSTSLNSDVTTAQPTAGPLFKWAAKQDVGGQKRRRLLCLVAAYADAGEPSPPAYELARRAGIPLNPSPQVFDGLLKALVRDGLLEVRWKAGKPGPTGGRRNVYTLKLDGGGR
jgi:hypothetical protein